MMTLYSRHASQQCISVPKCLILYAGDAAEAGQELDSWAARCFTYKLMNSPFPSSLEKDFGRH